jgi:ribA/ribD-fused uncharacterized protein
LAYAFSNFLPYKKSFQHCGIVVKTPEHFYQQAKTENTFQKIDILNAETPGRAKRLGAKCKLRPEWEEVKYGVMYKAQELKVFSEPDYRELVKNATPYEFIEWNYWHDNEWGSCVCEKCTDKPKKNLLQKVLLELQHVI